MLKSLNDITDQDLKEVESLASLFFTPKEIALQLEIEEELILSAVDDPTTGIYRAFQCGRLQSEMELRKSIIKLAKSGSSPAQTMAMDLLMKSKIKMLD